MKTWSLLRDRSFLPLVVSLVVLQTAIIVSEMMTLNDPDRLRMVTDIASLLTAAVATGMYVWACLHMGRGDLSTSIWSLLGLGVGLWTVAEAIWTYYELVLGIETPYPGVADAFWLAGYIPLYAGILLRYRSLRGAYPRVGVLAPLFAAIVGALLAVYVVRPVLESFEPERLLESIINLGYPLGDYGLCVLSLIIIFALERGRHGIAWRILGAGLIASALADSLFSYASWNELYYPDGQANAVSLVSDLTFNISYLLMGLAVVAYARSAAAAAPGMTQLSLKPSPKTNVLIVASPSGRVLSASDNLADLRGMPSAAGYVGGALGPALGLDDASGRDLIREIQDKGPIVARPFLLPHAGGSPLPMLLFGLRMHNREQNIDMLAFILRSGAEPAAGAAAQPLSEQQRMLVDYYLRSLGANKSEDDVTLRNLVLGQLNLLYSILQQHSGTPVAESLLTHLSEEAGRNRWPFACVDHTISIPGDLRGEQYSGFVAPLLHAAQTFASNMTDATMVRQEMRDLQRSLRPEARAYINTQAFRAVF